MRKQVACRLPDELLTRFKDAAGENEAEWLRSAIIEKLARGRKRGNGRGTK
jgi:hypothetical protein